jgi:prepilin-type N-terminal cleavage/methylation domain-containing protein
MKARRHRAFTLVELLVVIIIIGILAAVAIPQFGDASTDAKKSALKENLRTLRSAIEKYYHDHNSAYPGVVKTHKTTAAGAAAAHTDAAEAFLKQLTAYSDVDGNTCDEKNASFPFKPYLKRKIPDNPLAASGAASDPDSVSVTTDTTRLTADASPTTGWKVSSETGEIIANESTYASY